ncbi:MAG TPA: hypothetical protein VGQ83_01745 [Polyangia bacterium]|jgi:hypothetical protein
MDALALRRFWSAHFPDVPPLGWRLRAALPERWLRIHSLPGGTRYAEGEAERAEVLRRVNACCDELFAGGGRVAIILPVWVDAAPRCAGDLARLDPRVAWTEDDDGVARRLYAATFAWRRGILDETFGDVADDKLRAVLVGLADAAVVAPYDGGVDLFAASAVERDRLAARFAQWRSQRPDGL